MPLWAVSPRVGRCSWHSSHVGNQGGLLASLPRTLGAARGFIQGSARRRAALEVLRVLIFAILLVAVAFPIAWWFGKSSAGIDPDSDTAWEFALIGYGALLLLGTSGGATIDSAFSLRTWPPMVRWVAVAALAGCAIPWFNSLQVVGPDPLPSLQGWLTLALVAGALCAVPVAVGAGLGALLRGKPTGAGDANTRLTPDRPMGGSKPTESARN